MPSLCGSAEATPEWFRAFAAHSFLTCRPLRPRRVRHRYFPELRCRHWPSPNDHRLGTPNTPAIRSTRAVDFVASLVRFRYSLPGCLPPCTDQTGILPQPPGTFTSRLSTDRSSSPLLDITTTATGLLCWRDSHPLEWQLASLHGHSRPTEPFRAGVDQCPLLPRLCCKTRLLFAGGPDLSIGQLVASYTERLTALSAHTLGRPATRHR